MFIRRKKNKSGSISVYILEKRDGKQNLIKSVGSSSDESEIIALEEKAFRMSKTDLKVRPIYHQKSNRISFCYFIL